MKGLVKTLFLSMLLTVFLVLTACATSIETPPPTVQAVVDNSELLSAVDPQGVEVLQDTGFGSGRILLYQWENAQGQTCLGNSYIISVNNQWQTSDTSTIPCESSPQIMAAYTGNSEVESHLGLPRQTVVYGTAQSGIAVQIVWADGQVQRVPLENGSFLSVRSGRLAVQRIELVDQNNQLIGVKDWSALGGPTTN